MLVRAGLRAWAWACLFVCWCVRVSLRCVCLFASARAEELIQAEIVDESDVYEDNVGKRRVFSSDEAAAQQRRLAFNKMLDPRELHDTHLDAVEIAAVSSFLAANVEAFSPLLISAPGLQDLLTRCTVVVAFGGADEAPPYAAGQVCEQCTVVLQGRLHVVCGSEGFESDRGPWTVLGAPSLRLPHYEADFTARVMEPSRLLRITRVRSAPGRALAI